MSQTQQITIDKSLLEQCLLTLNEKPNYMSKCGRNSYDIAVDVEKAIKDGTKLTHIQKVRRVLEDIISFLQRNGYSVSGAHNGEERIFHAELEDVRTGRQPVSHLVAFVTATEIGSVAFVAPSGKQFILKIISENLPLEAIYDMASDDKSTLLAGEAVVEARMKYIERTASWL